MGAILACPAAAIRWEIVSARAPPGAPPFPNRSPGDRSDARGRAGEELSFGMGSMGEARCEGTWRDRLGPSGDRRTGLPGAF